MGADAVIFDYDGVLYKSGARQYDWFRYWWKHPVNKKKGAFPYSNVGDFMRMHNDQIQREGGVWNVYKVLGLECDMEDKSHVVWREYGNYLVNYGSGGDFDLKKIFSKIKKNSAKLGVVTNNLWDIAGSFLLREGVLDYVDLHISSEVLDCIYGRARAVRKPSNVPLSLISNKFGINPEKSFYVGDTLVDLLATRAVLWDCGRRVSDMNFIGVDYGYEERGRLEEGVDFEGKRVYPDYIVSDLEDILDIVF